MCFKDNNKTAHWFGHWKLKTLNIEGVFLRKKFINYLQSSLTGDTIEQSDYGRKDNPDFLQEAEEQGAQEANSDADVTPDASKIN